jgi:uncharacterized protein (UPF0333 family)
VSSQRGQASAELLAAVPALVLAGLIALQLLATAYTAHLADNAAEAGALASAAGRPAKPAAIASLPGWARSRIEVTAAGGTVSVALRPPTPIGVVAEALAVESSAWVRPADA